MQAAAQQVCAKRHGLEGCSKAIAKFCSRCGWLCLVCFATTSCDAFGTPHEGRKDSLDHE